jgi:hypothetical protein
MIATVKSRLNDLPACILEDNRALFSPNSKLAGCEKEEIKLEPGYGQSIAETWSNHDSLIRNMIPMRKMSDQGRQRQVCDLAVTELLYNQRTIRDHVDMDDLLD